VYDQNMRFSLKSLKRVNKDSISSPKAANAMDTKTKGNKFTKRRSKSKFGPKDSRN
jgi:hypothetical protein